MVEPTLHDEKRRPLYKESVWHSFLKYRFTAFKNLPAAKSFPLESTESLENTSQYAS